MCVFFDITFLLPVFQYLGKLTPAQNVVYKHCHCSIICNIKKGK